MTSVTLCKLDSTENLTRARIYVVRGVDTEHLPPIQDVPDDIRQALMRWLTSDLEPIDLTSLDR